MGDAATTRVRPSASEPDWSREKPRAFWDPGRKLIKTLRDYNRLPKSGALAALRRAFIVARHRFWSVVTASDVPLGFNPGGGLIFPHPTGIVIHPSAVIGPNCMIMHQATIGAAGRRRKGAAMIGGHVDIGAGAKIVGAVTIGDHAVIGANAVVTIDVPADSVAVGVPARIVAREGAPDEMSED